MRASPRASPASSWSRPPASGTWPADRCSGSVTIASFRAGADSLRAQIALGLDDRRWLGASDSEVREFLVGADRVTIETVLNDRELEALDYGYRERVWDTHLDHIRELPRVLPALFAEAAWRAREAGFDGVALHYAHAYTMASFLSRLNTRPDGYGGPREHRVRLPLEVLE